MGQGRCALREKRRERTDFHTISASGRAVWVLRYRHGQRRYELTLGWYPDIGLAEARAMATLKRADILKGVNPVVEKRKAKAAAAKDWSGRAGHSAYVLPARSHARARRNGGDSHAHFFDLGSRHMPEVQAADAAAAAEWIPLEKLAGMEDQFHDEHFHMLDFFFSLTPHV